MNIGTYMQPPGSRCTSSVHDLVTGLPESYKHETNGLYYAATFCTSNRVQENQGLEICKTRDFVWSMWNTNSIVFIVFPSY